jgi:RNA recognition motif-containing protein
LEQSIPVVDEETVKLRGLTSDITEEDITNVMKRFGKIKFVRVPMEDSNNPYHQQGKQRNRGFAFVTFEHKDYATRAIEQGEVTLEFSTIEIERALKRPP